MQKFCLTVASLVLIWQGAALSAELLPFDRVELKNGDSFVGTIEEQKFGDYVLLKRKDGTTTKVAFQDIASIKKVAPDATTVPPTQLPVEKVSPDVGLSKSEVPEVTGEKNLLWFFRIGGTFSNATDYTTKYGSKTSTSKDKAKGTIEYEFGVSRIKLGPVLSFDVSFGKHNYEYEDGTTADSHYYLLFSPKVYLGEGRFRGWAGLGIGGVLTSIGDSTYSSSGISIKVDSTALSLAFAPRIGAEIEINDGFFVTPYLSYFTTSPTLNGTATVSGTDTKFTIDASRVWFTAGIGITHKLNI